MSYPNITYLSNLQTNKPKELARKEIVQEKSRIQPRPWLKEYGLRLRQAEWCYDELSRITDEWSYPKEADPTEEEAIANMRQFFGFASPHELEILKIAKQRQDKALAHWDRYDDYLFLKEYCNALFDFKSAHLKRMYFGVD